MPYIIKKVKNGYKVCKKSDKSECYSKEGLPLTRAKKQMAAINISEHKKKLVGGVLTLDKLTELADGLRAKGAIKPSADGSSENYHMSGPHKIHWEDFKKTINELLSEEQKPKLAMQLRHLSDDITRGAPMGKFELNKMFEKLEGGRRYKLKGGAIDKETFLRRQSKGIYPGLTYEKYLELENQNRANIDKELAKLKESQEEYKQNPDVMCSYDENGERVKTRTSEAECKVNHQKSIRTQNDKSFIGKVVNTLTDVADFAVDKLPFIPAPVKGIYKIFGPPTSKYQGNAKPLTARLGGKVLLKKEIVNRFFPNSDDYKTYVEPFVGGGSVYFFKDKDGHKEVVNDIDPSLYTIFKGFQKYPANKIANEVNGDYDKKDFEKLLEMNPSNDFDKFIRTFLLSRLSYFAREKTFGKPRINSTFEGYQERLQDAIILNKDYKEVIKKYDSKDTFFYLDPPYKESQSGFNYPAINIKELKDVLSKIKGKFLLSFPDDKDAKDLFKDKYNIYEIKTKYTGRRQQGGQTMPAKEILVSNYEAPLSGGNKPLDQKLYDDIKAEIYKKNPKHSLFRSAQIAKEYKKRGGKWDTKKKPEMGIRKWFNQKWITLNDYYHKDEVVPCGSSDTYEKYDEYPLCRPMDIAKKLGKKKIGQMLEKKQGPKQLKTEDVLGTKKYNIKPTMSGSGSMAKFHKQLEKVGLNHDLYMKAVKKLAKESGYDPSKVEMSDDGVHKLVYHSTEGLKRFGRVGYGDYIIWSFKEAKGQVPEGYASKKRNTFRKSHGAMTEKYNLGKYSENELAINLLW
jgi:DNA adenine methylase